MAQLTRFWYISLSQAMKAQGSLDNLAASQESLLHVYTKYGCKWRLTPKFRPLVSLDMSAGAFIGNFICICDKYQNRGAGSLKEKITLYDQ